MAWTYATISSDEELTSSSVPAKSTVVAFPNTVGHVLTRASEGRRKVGPAVAYVGADGVLDLKIPTNSDQQPSLLWSIFVHSAVKVPGAGVRGQSQDVTQSLGTFAIVTHASLAELAPVETTPVNATLMDTVAGFAAQAQAHRDAAAAHRAAVEAVVATNDGIMSAAVNDDASATNTSLRGKYALGVNVTKFGAFTTAGATATNTATLQAANDAVRAAGGGRVILPPGLFNVRGLTQDARVELFGPGTTLRNPDGDAPDILSARTYSTTGTIAAGSKSLTVADATGIEVGAVIGIRAAGGYSPLQNTKLSANITSTQVSGPGIVLDNVTGLPTAGYLVIGTEVIQYTGLSGNTLTGATRGVYGTTAAAHTTAEVIGTAMRHIAIVTAVAGNVISLDIAAPFAVTAAPVTTGIVGPKLTGITFDGNRIVGGAASTVYPVRWSQVRLGKAEVTTKRGEAAFYLGQGACDNDVVVDGDDCSVPEGGKQAVVWAFQSCHRNKIRTRITHNLWAGVYLDNRTTSATEWDGPCNDNRIEIVCSIEKPAAWITNTAVLIVGGNNNHIKEPVVSGVRTAFAIEVGNQHQTHDGSAPPCRGNVIDHPTISDVYQPWVLSVPNNYVIGARWGAETGGDNTGACPILLSTPNLNYDSGGIRLGGLPAGLQNAPGLAFLNDIDTGFYPSGTGEWTFVKDAALVMRLRDLGIIFYDGKGISFGTGTGGNIGQAPSQKLAFWGKTPIVQPAAIANTSGLTLANVEAEVNKLKVLLRDLGLMSL